MNLLTFTKKYHPSNARTMAAPTLRLSPKLANAILGEAGLVGTRVLSGGLWTGESLSHSLHNVDYGRSSPSVTLSSPIRCRESPGRCVGGGATRASQSVARTGARARVPRSRCGGASLIPPHAAR